jgi:hypothetical protein
MRLEAARSIDSKPAKGLRYGCFANSERRQCPIVESKRPVRVGSGNPMRHLRQLIQQQQLPTKLHREASSKERHYLLLDSAVLHCPCDPQLDGALAPVNQWLVCAFALWRVG